jgi:hypothetical protein
MQVEVNALGMKLAEQAEQVLERAAEAVDRPCGDMLISRRATALSSRSSPGRFSRPFVPEMPAS